MSLNERTGGGKMSSGSFKFLSVTISTGLLFLALFATSEPVCYTRHTLDDRSVVVKKTNCTGDSDQLCARFASRSDANLFAVLNSSCYGPEGDAIYPEGRSQQKDLNTITCSTTNLPTVANGTFDCPTNFDVSMGEACNLTCNYGYFPAFSHQVVCQVGEVEQGGEWSEGNLTCQAITCSTTNLPMVAHGTFDCPNNSYVSMGEACYVTCNDGCLPPFSGQIVCQRGEVDPEGEWSKGNFTCVECNGWNEWGKNEYKFINTTQNWKASQEFCESHNASLAVVGSRQENAFLQNILTCCCDKWGAWIESFILTNGLWKWRGQAEAPFINWVEGEPSYYPGNTSMVLIIKKTGEWADILSFALRPALCERSKYSD